MRTYLCGAIILFFIISLSSCQKEIDGNSKQATSDSTLIREIIKIDTTRVPGQDTLARIFFKYDSRERLSKIISLGYALTPAPKNVFEQELQYSGYDTLPKLFISKRWNDFANYGSQAADYKDSLYFFYSGDKIVKDSLLYNTAINTAVITTFSEVQPGRFQVHIKEVFKSSGAFSSDRGTFNIYTIKSGNNFTELKDTIPFFGGPLPRKLNLTFDNKINLFKKIALHYPFYRNYYFDGYVTDIIPYYLTNRNDNNIVSMNSWSLPSPIIFNYSYDYNTNNLPIQIRTLSVRDYNELYRYDL